VVEPGTGSGLQGRPEDSFWRSVITITTFQPGRSRAALMPQRGFGAFHNNPQNKESFDVYRDEQVPGEEGG
jgi:hypothetical protein